ncbi:MAG TPA: DNA methyltransferase, partial [Longimicrobiaceae bacterium]|nr:DNA methyltransferase [Longimicrobiaceae bacterium]
MAKFLMRCVFTMFAEDVELLAGKPFQTALAEYRDDPAEFAATMEELWRAMDEGRRFGLKKLLRFNGHFFRDASALPLTKADLAVLFEAARADWKEVEPTIFGTLLTRALDPRERHKLGAEYTPRAYVERVVRQTVEVPIRDRWDPVQAEVIQLLQSGKKKDRATAEKRLREFHAWLKSLRFLDPACGSGNFLYVTLLAVKRIELEVLRELWKLVHQAEIGILEKAEGSELGVEEVGPWQFHGIEIKPWAREIAELTLWIGYHQFWMEHHRGTNPPEPVLRDTGTLEQRDAVLAWDEIVEVPEKSRPDPTPRIKHPVTGKLVPDPDARLPYCEYRGARQAEWPQADFIIANPPYMGNKRMREAFGDGYVDALRLVYPAVPEVADYVMYWWHRAAKEVDSGSAIRAGLITTNSITQAFNRLVVQDAFTKGAEVIWAIPDHPWVNEGEGAAVRVAMTVIAQTPAHALLVQVDERGEVVSERHVTRLNSDLTAHADVASAAQQPLLSNVGVSSRGFTLVGRGFVLNDKEAQDLRISNPDSASLIREYLNGRDFMGTPRRAFVVDFGMQTEFEAQSHSVLYDLVRTRVRPERTANS